MENKVKKSFQISAAHTCVYEHYAPMVVIILIDKYCIDNDVVVLMITITD